MHGGLIFTAKHAWAYAFNQFPSNFTHLQKYINKHNRKHLLGPPQTPNMRGRRAW